MNIKELLKQLDEFFDLSKKKQRKKHEKLLDIITSLEKNKVQLKKAMQCELKIDKNSNEIYDMCKEFKVITKLLKKAKKREKKIRSEIDF